MKTIIFLDTNIFHHYQSIKNIPWDKLTNSNNIIELIVAPVIIRELETQKYDENQKKRKKAEKAVKLINQIIQEDNIGRINDSIFLRFLPEDPPEYLLAQHRLRKFINDDQLIATIIYYYKQHSMDELFLATLDTGIKLKSRQYEIIKYLEIPEQYRLIEDYKESLEIKNLKKEIKELKRKIPKIDIYFKNLEKMDEYSLGLPSKLDESFISKELNRIMEEHPKINPTECKKKKGKGKYKNYNLGEIFQEMYIDKMIEEKGGPDKYNDELDKYYEKYKKYLIEIHRYKNQIKRMIVIKFIVNNEGTCPAEDIDMDFHFPDGFSIYNKETIPRKPKQPQAPDQISLPTLDYISPSIIGSNTLFESLPAIKKTNSYNVNYYTKYLKHNDYEELSPLYLIFNSYDEAKSFKIDYTIRAANIPEKISGNLNIIIEKTNDRQTPQT